MPIDLIKAKKKNRSYQVKIRDEIGVRVSSKLSPIASLALAHLKPKLGNVREEKAGLSYTVTLQNPTVEISIIWIQRQFVSPPTEDLTEGNVTVILLDDTWSEMRYLANGRKKTIRTGV